MKTHSLPFIGFDTAYSEANVVMFGAPFDGTTTFRPGTRFATQYIRPDSYGLETYSPHQDLDLEDFSIADIGDLELPFGDKMRSLEMIHSMTQTIVNDHKKPLMVGGEHLVSYGSIKALYEAYPDLHVIQLDAHTDLRTDYMGEAFSHSSVIARCHDFLGDGRIFQFGIRSGLKSEFEWAKEGHTHLQKFNFDGLSDVIASLKGKPLYLTIDLDVLDPSVFPGTGTPEPGGVSYKELLDALSEITKHDNLVAADIVELSPQYDVSGASTAAACKTIREVALMLSK